jgi:hypothetical protein
MKDLYLPILFVVMAMNVCAQGVRIADDASAPDASAGLEVDFDNRGFLPPRLTSSQRDAIANPVAGLHIYNTDTNCDNFFNGTSWRELCGNCTPQPTTSDAGPDQPDLEGTSATLAANTPSAGTGAWSVNYGSGGSFADPASPQSVFTGLEGETYILTWTISNVCDVSQDDVMISFVPGDPCDNQASVTDARDSQVYPVVSIGQQCWMAANLNYGTMIPGTSEQTAGQGQKYCYNDSPAIALPTVPCTSGRTWWEATTTAAVPIPAGFRVFAPPDGTCRATRNGSRWNRSSG